MIERISAEMYWLDVFFGERVPKCRHCGTIDAMWNDYARAAMRCQKCEWLEANEQVEWVPKDERVREAMGK